MTRLNQLATLFITTVLATNSFAAGSETRAKDSQVRDTRAAPKGMMIKKQTPAKPDFVITQVKKMPGNGKFRATVKNKGAAYGAKKAALWADHKTSSGGNASAAVEMPQVFGAGEQKYIDITFNPANFRKGDKVIFKVDYFKAVPEKNESNNIFNYTYQ